MLIDRVDGRWLAKVDAGTALHDWGAIEEFANGDSILGGVEGENYAT